MPEESEPTEPTLPGGVSPDEMIARAMQSVRMTGGAGAHGWNPPSIEESARLFPSYEVLALLGRGGMGAVYQARQTSLDRLVAIKLLPLEVSVDQAFADRFRREARAMAKLNHPNILSVFDFGTTSEGHLFIVMEYVEGANLHDIIHQVGLEPTQALAIVEQICAALGYAHGKGVIHRDIKPANVMIDTESQVKVADFGLARLMDHGTADLGHTVTGTVMGTPDYMAPEQTKGMNVDHRADIYSLGVMFYEMLCGEVPKGAFELPSQRVSVDARVDQVVLKAMQQAPDRRYQNTAEMKTDVYAIRTTPLPAPPQAPAQSVRSERAAPGKPPDGSRKRLRPKTVRITLGLGVGLVALLACWAFVSRELAISRESMVNHLEPLMDVVGSNSTAALTFRDADSAAENLSSLRAADSVVAACIYDGIGGQLANYSAGETAPTKAPPDGARFVSDSLVIVRPILLNDKRLGTIYIKARPVAVWERLQSAGKTAGGLFLSTVALGVFGVRRISDRRLTFAAPIIGSTLAALIICGGFLPHELAAARESMTRGLTQLGDVLARMSTAIVAFKDWDAGNDTLAALRAEQAVLAAGIYDASGAIMARYRSDHISGSDDLPARPGPYRVVIENDRATVCRPVLLNERTIGAIYIRADTNELSALQSANLRVALVIVLGALALGVALALSLRTLLHPPQRVP